MNTQRLFLRTPARVALAAVVAAGISTSVPAVAASFSYFPTPSATDGRLLSLSGTKLNTLEGTPIQIRIDVPAVQSTFDVGIFDGDTSEDATGNLNQAGGHWDTGTSQVIYTLLADPAGDGSGTTVVARWTGNDPNTPPAGALWTASSPKMPDNAWWDATITNSPAAKNSSGGYTYSLQCVLEHVDTVTQSSFKVRSDSTLRITPQTWSIEGVLATMPDGEVIYPLWDGVHLPGEPGSPYPNNFWITTPTTYDGSWDFVMEVPPGSSTFTLWDGDFDYGTDPTETVSDLTNTPIVQTADTSDPDTQAYGAAFLPSWATGTAVLPESAKGVGNPPDDSPFDVLRRSPSVQYQVIDPYGNVYLNSNPSGNLEWEQFKITVDPAATRNDADYSPTVSSDGITFVPYSTLPAGRWRVHVLGLDLGNTVYFHPSYYTEGVPGTTCSSGVFTIGYWKNHPAAWPSPSVTLGSVTYSEAQAIALLDQAPRGDIRIILAHQLIGAILNVEGCNESDCITPTINAAESFLSQYPLGASVSIPAAARNAAEQLNTTLTAYNQGQLCVPSGENTGGTGDCGGSGKGHRPGDH